MSVLCRTRGDYKVTKPSHYVNYSVQLVDGKPVHKPCDPVAPSLAAEYSVGMNLLRGTISSSHSRLNVDAVDLPETLDNFKED